MIWAIIGFGIASVIAGYCEGAVEWMLFRLNPDASVSGWYGHPAATAHRKYKLGLKERGPRFFLSTTLLVWATDAYHLARTYTAWYPPCMAACGVYLAISGWGTSGIIGVQMGGLFLQMFVTWLFFNHIGYPKK